MEKKLADVLSDSCNLKDHRHCEKCGKKMCFYNAGGDYWVCYGPGICVDCYTNQLPIKIPIKNQLKKTKWGG